MQLCQDSWEDSSANANQGCQTQAAARKKKKKKKSRVWRCTFAYPSSSHSSLHAGHNWSCVAMHNLSEVLFAKSNCNIQLGGFLLLRPLLHIALPSLAENWMTIKTKYFILWIYLNQTMFEPGVTNPADLLWVPGHMMGYYLSRLSWFNMFLSPS